MSDDIPKLNPCPLCSADKEVEVDQTIIKLNHKDDCVLREVTIKMQFPEEVEQWNNLTSSNKVRCN